jgi:hypothetical protein
MYPGICTGNLCSDFSMFDTFNAQELNNMTLFQVHQIGTFDYLQFISQLGPPVIPREMPNCHSIHEFPMAIAGAGLSPAGKGEAH